MSVFKTDKAVKRVIFNIDAEVFEQLEAARTRAKRWNKRLDLDGAVNRALEKFLKKAEKKLDELEEEKGGKKRKQMDFDSEDAVQANGETDDVVSQDVVHDGGTCSQESGETLV